MDVLSHHPVNVTSFGNRVFTVVVSPVSQCGVAFCDVLHEEVHLAVDTQSEEGLGRQRRTPEPCVHKPNTAEARPPEAGGGRGGGGRSRTSAALQQLDSRPAGSGGWRIQLCGWSRPVCGVALRSLSRRGVSSSESLNPVTERWLLLLSPPLSSCPGPSVSFLLGPFWLPEPGQTQGPCGREGNGEEILSLASVPFFFPKRSAAERQKL